MNVSITKDREKFERGIVAVRKIREERRIRIKSNQIERNCRICYEEEGDLFSPCVCVGSHGLVHRACLDKWRLRFSSNHQRRVFCEICMCEYNYQLNSPREPRGETGMPSSSFITLSVMIVVLATINITSIFLITVTVGTYRVLFYNIPRVTAIVTAHINAISLPVASRIIRNSRASHALRYAGDTRLWLAFGSVLIGLTWFFDTFNYIGTYAVYGVSMVLNIGYIAGFFAGLD